MASRRPRRGSDRRKPAPRPKPSKTAAPPQSPPSSIVEPVRLIAPDGTWVGPKGGSKLTYEKLGLTPEKLLALFRGMLAIRVLDARMLNLQRQGRIGFYGQSTGQEAAIIGSAAAIGPDDWVAPALREAGVAVWRGLPLDRLVAQCMGKASEPSQGRQMPCHHTFKDGHFLAMSSVIATQLLHATGIALAAKIRKDPVVCLGYLGDGATSEHDFHSALNFAAVTKAPVVFVCQNNQWAISVPVSRQTASRTLAIKANAYGMPGARVDGNDVLAVHEATREAVERARKGGGPTFIEAVTYRRMGHSSSDDPTRYRPVDEVKKWERLDPIDRFRRHLAGLRLLTKEKEAQMEEELQAAISEAIRVAEQGADPQPASLVTDVFAEVTPQLREQRDELLASLARRKEENRQEGKRSDG